MRMISQLFNDTDCRAAACLVLLWLLFFWRLFTPIAADQASLTQGDFSGQFVAFAGYQYERMSRGEIPLWNPYNNGGLPFIGDTQAAVFYPPRWLTIGISKLAGGWSYNSLQMEMALHVLAYTLLMYLFARRLTMPDARGPLAAFCAALIIGYGGYVTGYPPLQLAVLEAAIWLPAMALGILEATRGGRLRVGWLALAGFSLGMSWLAGHPQTSWFISIIGAGYLLFRCLGLEGRWRSVLLGMPALALISFGVCAVSLLPGIEYLLLSSREAMGYAAKGNGFPIRDMAQLLWPGALSQWSPLFVGLPALFFAAVAVARGWRESRFWLLAAFLGLLHSLGDNSAFYAITYNFVPGLRFFRGQERAAVVAANSLAILAGLGIVAAAAWHNQLYRQRALRYWRLFAAILAGVAILALCAWAAQPQSYGDLLSVATRSALVAVAACFVLSRYMNAPRLVSAQLAVAALIAFELFTVNIDHPAVYDSLPADQQVSMSAPPLVKAIQADASGQPFRVDGFRGLEDNYGSLYAIMDMRGISPLWLKGPRALAYADYTDNPLAWELFAVKYVFSAQQRLSIPSDIIDSGSDSRGQFWLHKLLDPRPFAMLFAHADVVDSDEWARELMADPRYDERHKLLAHQPPTLELPAGASDGQATVSSFAPEEIVIDLSTRANALLSLALPHYPGWQARVDGKPTAIIRAYAGLSAVEIPAGSQRLILSFAPPSYTLGLVISGLTWLGLALAGLLALRGRR